MIISLSSESETLALGARLAALASPPCMIFLQGDLGAGKTTLVRGFLQSLGYENNVKSPTYTLVESYCVKEQQIFHFDLYRLVDSDELENIGIRDYFALPAIWLTEWPERAQQLLPPADLTCYIRATDFGREVELRAESNSGKQIIQLL